jgi:hypothetical protein
MTDEERMIFAIDLNGGVPQVIVGIPHGAWEHIKDGEPCVLDLARSNVPVKVVVVGGRDHDAIQATIDRLIAQADHD